MKTNRSARPPARWMEILESRQLLSAVAPTNDEQYLLELINRARANPAAEAARYGIDLNEGLAAGTITTTPKQPLAFSGTLIDAARKHSQDMTDHVYFAHEGSDGSSPGDRMSASGYNFQSGNGYGWGENIAYRSEYPSVPNPTTTTARIHQDLFVDSGVDGRGHRLNLLNPDFKEVGTGVVSGVYPQGGTNYNAVMATEDFAYVTPSAFLTGVAYRDDVVANQFYTPGEGLGGVTITATRTSDQQTFSTTTFSSGGYSLKLAPGTYGVTASGGGLSSPISYNSVTIGGENVKRDFVPGQTVDPNPPPSDTTPPTATLRAGRVTRAGARVYTFTVTYTDQLMKAASLATGNVRVSNGRGFAYTAKLISRSSKTNQATITATYQIIPPGKSWDWRDNGQYTVSVLANKVSDAAGNYMAAGSLGNFQVKIARRTAR